MIRTSKSIEKHSKRFRLRSLACVAAASLGLLPSPRASAQHLMYPKKEGQFQPFHFQQLPSWVSFEMELRGRTEGQTSLNFVSGNGRVYELTRVWGSMTIRPTSWATGYLQFLDTHALGLPLYEVASNMRDVFDFRQGYVDFHHEFSRVPEHLFIGRQELKFGDERVVGISDWTNNSRTWDGVDLRLGGKNTVDLFSTSVVAIHPTSLDKHGAGLTFHGAEGNITTLLPRTSLQPFVLVRALPRVISQQGVAGTETEVSPGIFFDTALPFHLDASGTGLLQRGSYSNDSIHAGAAIIRGGYTFANLPWQPHLQAGYKYATGNPHTNPYRIGTYDQQYPSNHDAFGLVDIFGFQNIKQNRLKLFLDPSTNLTVLLATSSLHLASRRDTVYSGSASSIFKAPTAGFRSDGIGTEFDASAKYAFRKDYIVNIGVGHFFPGEVMTTSKHGAPQTLAYLQFTYRFRLSK